MGYTALKTMGNTSTLHYTTLNFQHSVAPTTNTMNSQHRLSEATVTRPASPVPTGEETNPSGRRQPVRARCPRPQTWKLKVVPARKRVRALRAMPLKRWYETFPTFARRTSVLYFAALILLLCLGCVHQCQSTATHHRRLPDTWTPNTSDKRVDGRRDGRGGCYIPSSASKDEARVKSWRTKNQLYKDEKARLEKKAKLKQPVGLNRAVQNAEHSKTDSCRIPGCSDPSKKFNLGIRISASGRHWCRACGKTMGNCCTKKAVVYGPDFAPEEAKVCKICYVFAPLKDQRTSRRRLDERFQRESERCI